MKLLILIAAATAGLLAPAAAAPVAAAPIAAEAPQVERTTVVRNRNGTTVRTTTTRRYSNNRRYERRRGYNRGYRTVCTTRYRYGERRRVCRRVRR